MEGAAAVSAHRAAAAVVARGTGWLTNVKLRGGSRHGARSAVEKKVHIVDVPAHIGEVDAGKLSRRSQAGQVFHVDAHQFQPKLLVAKRQGEGASARRHLGLVVIVWTFYGVNYVMATGLHSYGFGSGGEQWVGLWALLELLFLAVCFIRYRGRKAAARAMNQMPLGTPTGPMA